ncbi:hypothetical protein B6D60_08010 [candidate division KSB1 bacterium 4484_87]|nr:MAG: hypothetical protein B6D60_08010 [candidate division KSB1 bacterium 4484_87]
MIEKLHPASQQMDATISFGKFGSLFFCYFTTHQKKLFCSSRILNKNSGNKSTNEKGKAA